MGMIEDDLLALTDQVLVRAHRIAFDTGSTRATIPMLRGVWGRAMHELEPIVYAILFEGRHDRAKFGVGQQMLPLYVLRPAPPDPAFAPAVDLLLFGEGCDHASTALHALEVASKAGLGAKREPFRIEQVCGLSSDGQRVAEPQTWFLRSVAECLILKVSGSDRLRLEFDGPLRILRKGKLLMTPSFVDIAVAGLRRLVALASADSVADVSSRVLEMARTLSASEWHGQRQDFVRWSGRQSSNIEMRGVTGWLGLPDGAGPFRPLLAACQWTHIGKGTVFGLGEYKVRPY